MKECFVRKIFLLIVKNRNMILQIAVMIIISGGSLMAAEFGGEIGAEVASQHLNGSSRFNPGNVQQLRTFSYFMTGDLWFKNEFNQSANGFIKLESRYRPASFDKNDETQKIVISEIYIDLVSDWCSIRAGKQFIKWGDGVFFNPADVVNASRDPLRPSNEAEGNPVIHISIPIQSYATIDLLGIVREGETDSTSDLPAVFRISSGSGNMSMFGYAMVQKNRTPVYGYNADFVLSLSDEADLTMYTEGILRKSSRLSYIDSNGTVAARKDGMYWGTTIGGRINLKFPAFRHFDKWTVMAEYYRNDENWSRGEYGNMYDHLPADITIGKQYVPFRGGRQYLYSNLSVSNVFISFLSIDSGVVLNLEDRSGIALESLSYQYNDNTEIGGRSEFYFGRNDTEFGNALITRKIGVYAKISF
jgi:hypothetical protein